MLLKLIIYREGTKRKCVMQSPCEEIHCKYYGSEIAQPAHPRGFMRPFQYIFYALVP